MGGVVRLGILALVGIIMRDSVILVDQIDQQIKVGGSLLYEARYYSTNNH